MRNVVYSMMVSLDGFVEAPDGVIGWSAPGTELHQHFNDLQDDVDLWLYGRRLYENMAAFWPTADGDPEAEPVVAEFARLWKRMPKVVFSTTLADVGWNARLVRDDVAAEVGRLKREPGKDIEVGGAGLAASLLRADLIDEVRLYVHPIVLGGGKPMFPASASPLRFEPVENRAFPCGVVLLAYRRGRAS